MSHLVSGEAVVLDVRSAKAASRGLGFAIDATLQVGLLVAVSFGSAALASALGGDTAVQAATALVAIVFALVGYPVIWETTTRGRSPGKYALGLRVVRNDGGAVRFRHSLIRALFGVIELWATLGVIAFIASLSSDQGRRLGDQYAGTRVVYVRAPRSNDVRWAMPPRMAAWASGADLRALPDALALDIRTFLLRTPQLNAQARWSLAVRLADESMQHISPAPPAGLAPEEFLVALLAERRRRDEEGWAQSLAPTPPVTPTSTARAEPTATGSANEPPSTASPGFAPPA